ncbi:hypothetical protein E2C01_008473 [Portunus trituberculatus]|uniref:Uncharacterized protein n=1 Tax=Portunus trituberculatus TaxID=210409 RepID=A0A5B7D433_PORTR|nr:hypothetical protein [Portunus trituberculatus]
MGDGGVVEKVVSVESGSPSIGSNPTTSCFEAMPFVKCFKITYMSP